jgi:hypothetical protein
MQMTRWTSDKITWREKDKVGREIPRKCQQ